MSSKLRVIAPVVTFVAIVGLVLAAALLTGHGTHRPPSLHLTSASAGTAAAPQASGTDNPGYALEGSLPEGTPPDAPVWSLGSPADTSRLREALGDKGFSTSHAAWWWSQCAADQPVPVPPPDGSTGSGVGCASSGTVTAVAPGEPTPAPRPTLDPGRARQAAAKVFDAAGLDLTAATVQTSEYGGSVALTPPVSGLDTAGYTTLVQLDADAQITSASGFLGRPAQGDSYPLITARAAYERLPIMPRMELCRVAPDGKGCLEPPNPVITGAHLGLALQSTREGTQLLVPAWLFTVKGSAEPIAQVAVEPSYLGEDSPPTNPPLGTVEPGKGAPPSQVAPGEPASPPAKG